MKKTFFVLLLVLLVSASFYSVPQTQPNSTAWAPHITVCMDTSCYSGCACDVCGFTFTLFASNGHPTGLSCVATLPFSTCCSIDASSISAGDYYFTLNGCNTSCTGSVFHFNGSIGTDTVFCTDCAGMKKKKAH